MRSFRLRRRLRDPHAVPLGSDPREAVRTALEGALEQAGRPGEMPARVWITPMPGCEEKVLRGLHDVLGPRGMVAGRLVVILCRLHAYGP